MSAAHRLTLSAVAVLGLVAVPVAVDAAKPKPVKPKAGTYSGYAKVTRNSKVIAFRVPASKRSLQEIQFPTCSPPNGGNRKPVDRTITAKVSRKGKIKGEASFRSRAEFEPGLPWDELQEWTLKINGRFTKANKAKGRLSMSVTAVKVHKGTETPATGPNAGGSSCNTGSVTWRASRQ